MGEFYLPPALEEHPPLTDVTGQTADGGGSDRNKKANIAAVSGRDMLERLASIPISSWNYKADPPSIRHIGPMAQDFRAAFQVGKDDKTIFHLDANGVALAAIQALHQDIQSKDAQLASQQERISALEARLEALETKRG